MFKKAIEAKSLQRLSGADRKKLKRTVKEKFPQASDADIDIIFPPKTISTKEHHLGVFSAIKSSIIEEAPTAEITVAKFPNRAHVYAVEGDFPMIFDIDGRGTEIYPTVYALWKVPNLLPAFLLKGGEVSRFVIGGADLMFPGISIPPEGLPSFSVGEPWAVKVPGNPAPIAVGTTTMSSSEALKAGLRGKALRITHYYRDSLWESAEGHHVPNAGFFEDVVLEDPALVSVCQTSEVHEDTSNASNDLHGDGSRGNGEGQSLEILNAHIQLDVNASTEVDQKDEIPEEITVDMSGLNVVDTVSSEDINAEQQQHTLSIEEIDALLDKCLLQALHTTVKDKDLPLPGSTLWSSHVLPCRPSGITLDIKKSSHKKLSKWLQSKSSAGLISAKEDKHKKEVVLTRVNRGHPDYMSFRPDKRQPQSADHRNDSAPVEGRREKLQLEVVEIYKPSTHVNPIFTSVGVDPGNFYSATEATDVVFRYAENQDLVKPTDKATVVLDAVLCDALYKGTVKKGSSYPTEIHKKDLGPTFISRMQVHHRVSRGNESAVRKGALKTVQIVTERRQGNKKVTRVSGLESFLMDAEALASELQKKFACSTSVAELPGKKGQQEVLVQGGVIEDLGKILVEQYGIPKRYIEVLDKTRK